MKKGPIDKDVAKDIAALNDILELRGIYWVLTRLADAVRAQGKKKSAELSGSKPMIKLAEFIAKNIEHARDAT